MSKKRASDIDKVIGRNLRFFRQSYNWGQKYVGAYLGVSDQQVSKYEKGKDRLSASDLYKLSEALVIPVHSFFAGVMEDVHG